jgi:hypothetical protein
MHTLDWSLNRPKCNISVPVKMKLEEGDVHSDNCLHGKRFLGLTINRL